MPQTSQAAKRLRQDKKRAARNKAIKSRLKTLEKKVRSAVEEGNLDSARTELKVLVSAFDAAAAKGRVATKNKAARKKSRLTALVNAKASQPTA